LDERNGDHAPNITSKNVLQENKTAATFFFIGILRESNRNNRTISSGQAASSGTFLLPLHANAMWRTTFGIAESADVNVQLSKDADESATVHSQRAGGFALIPIDLSEDDKNKLFSEFF
jgi:hypothetical protein